MIKLVIPIIIAIMIFPILLYVNNQVNEATDKAINEKKFELEKIYQENPSKNNLLALNIGKIILAAVALMIGGAFSFTVLVKL